MDPLNSIGMSGIDPSCQLPAYPNYNVTSNLLLHGGAHSAVKLENGPSTVPVHPAMPPSGRGGVVKYCGVCGDIAKSYHFGGLSCDSCKAFFRRSVQNDNYLHFQCCHRGQCVISLSNRKSCQYCRMKRCFAIGMEKSWVMTEDERKALMKARAEKKLSKQLAASATSTTTGGKSIYNYSSDDGGSTTSSSDYEPQIERMVDFLAPVEIKEIESIVTKYMHAYQHVPYRSELRFFDHDRPGVQVMEMFGTLIRRFAFYARLMADFSSLPFPDQSCLLKGGVLEMCVLRGALVYDPLKNRWPNANMSMYKDAPTLKLDNIGHLTSSRIFQMHMEFINTIQQMGVDEPTIMLLILIVLFTPERAGLVRTRWIEKYQAYYTSLLERYMGWRFGTHRSKFMFGKLLTKLSDLRELSDTHNRHNLQLGNDEISSIQHQLQHLKINPYPECKVIPEDVGVPVMAAVDPSNPVHSSFPVTDAAQSYYAPTSDAAIPRTYTSDCRTEQDACGSSYLPLHHFPPVQHQQHHYAPSYPSGAAQSNEPYVNRQPTSLSSSSYPSSSCCVEGNTTGVPTGQQDPYRAYQQQQQQQQPQQQQQQPPPQMANMALQFMQAIQQSVNQVVNVPDFGFDWVKPDYQFDPMVDDEILDVLDAKTSTHQNYCISSVEDLSSPDSKSSNSSCGSSYSELNQAAVVALVDEQASADVTLTQRTMEELYEALEEYSELYDAH
ncbi:hypothetical protein OUZ56_000518 [Daphnia magna]|uniref:Retinoid x receptor n=1 Tax=Daphnia magna TaxID=35525 RepID=A0ABQ9ZZW7_9CRUS|nr:hypothetical protein OUZ56_000518 [Daphnia magna]